MNLNVSITILSLLSLILPYYICSFSGSSAAFYLLVAAAVVVLVAVMVARTVIVSWITVLVLLTFVGNRRRVLVKRGRKITREIGSHLIRVLISEKKGAFTFVCAAVLSLFAMAGLADSVSLSQSWS